MTGHERSPKSLLRHGLTGYKKHGCGCAVCRLANAAAQARYRRKRGDGLVYVGPKSIGRPGLVTVFDEAGHYVGCMGIQVWRRLLRENGRPGDVWDAADDD